MAPVDVSAYLCYKERAATRLPDARSTPVTALVYTPLVRGHAIELSGSRLWRKKLLPVGQVDYKGRKLQFTRQYLQDLAAAFTAKAYDQVPLQLAGADNAHTNDVERFGGQVVDADAGEDGLYITVRPTERGQQILQQNPQLGVSARIVENYERSDGQYFTAAIQHVLATLDPRIPGLGGWQMIEASNSAEMVVDLSSYQFEGDDDGVLGDMLDGLNPTPEEADVLVDILGEMEMEQAMISQWGDDPSLDELEREMPEYDYQDHLDDLSRVTAALEFSNDGPSSIDLVNDTFGPGTAERLAENGVPHMIAKLANQIDREARQEALETYRRSRGGSRRAMGDVYSLMESYSKIGARGHAVEAAHESGYDSNAVELSRFMGDIPDTCGPRDALGGCSAPYHDPGCFHVAQSAASTSPDGVAAYNAALARKAQQPHADELGRASRVRGDGRIATLADHLEASTGIRRRSSQFEQGPRTSQNPGRPEAVAIEPEGPAFSYSTLAAARALARQGGMRTSADHQAEREAWKREHARRQAAASPMSRRLNHPDYRWGELERQREQRAAARKPVQLSQPMLADGEEDVRGPICRSLGIGAGGW